MIFDPAVNNSLPTLPMKLTLYMRWVLRDWHCAAHIHSGRVRLMRHGDQEEKNRQEIVETTRYAEFRFSPRTSPLAKPLDTLTLRAR